jgi:hypothetical protein
MDWLSDTQLLLLREVVRTPRTLKDLCEVAGVTGEQVERDLACLYFASAVTSTPAKAASRADLLIQENDDTGFSTSGGDPSTAGDVSVAVPNEFATKLDDRTVPASLTGVVT